MRKLPKLRRDIRIRITLPPYIHDWLAEAVAMRSDAHMTRDRLVTEALRYFMTQPEDALGTAGLRVCCGTAPVHGHRGTCRHSAMRGGPGSAEYRALKRRWQDRAEL